MLNMRSDDDRPTSARIRDAAIAEFADHGVAGTTVRAVAAAAAVSPALVIHHFGSKDGLRDACDRHVAAMVLDTGRHLVPAGAGFDVLAALQSRHGGPPVARYLARTLGDGSPPVADLVDALVDRVVADAEEGVAHGMVKPSDHPRERAAVLTIWLLGGLVLHEHLERLIGVDLTADPSGGAAPVAYTAPVAEILGAGVYTDAAVDRANAAPVAGSSSRHQEQSP